MTNLSTKDFPRLAAEPVTPRPAEPAQVHQLAAFLVRRPGLALAVVVIAVVLAWAAAPWLFAPGDPLSGVPREKLRPPSISHLFGTDEIGRDLYTRVVHGAALSLRATVIAVGMAFATGSLIGLLAGFAGNLVDDVIMRIVDVLLSLPTLLLSLALVTALGFGTVHVAIAVGLATVARFARVMRAEVVRVRTATFVEAARSVGVTWWAILRRHVLPNAIGSALVLATLEFGTAILAVSSLSFLGFGAPPPTPQWGTLIAGGRAYLATAWWLTTLPGLVIAAVVLSTNRVARALDGESR